ncbi:Integral membrane protein [Labilithrix luteola]|uniref:Integral membrane protein n=1 Tax=Labilithrix luteola TaxID=1391654 RepID=A0A0K1QE63_9BACT|nr:hypothetical protein [Labilithrix luteola]AKV03957.1 Integral membrane protein [Labilithrix luteola]
MDTRDSMALKAAVPVASSPESASVPRVAASRWATLVPSPAVRFAAEVLLGALLAFVAFAADSGILTANLRDPTCPLVAGDGLSFAAMHFKGTFDNGWYVHNPFLGAPYGAGLEDFPAPDVFYLVLVKFLVALTHDWVLSYNLTVILGYPLAGAAAVAVVRKYGVRLPAALACGVLFAVLPFHQYRLYGHILFGFSYALVPLAVVPAIEVLRGSPVLFVKRPATSHSRWPVALRIRDRASIVVLVLAACTGLWGFVYFPFFALASYVVAGIAATAQQRSLLPALRAATCAGLTGGMFVLQNLGVIGYLHSNGRTPISARMAMDAEIFGLKLFQLVVPTVDHRLEAFRRFRRSYDLTAPLANENATAYLGLVGAVGLLVLFVVLLRGTSSRRTGEADASSTDLLWPLAILNVGAFLLGTIGGIGSLVAFAGFPDVRSYNRISVFIGFYALFAMAILVDRLLVRVRTTVVRGGVIAVVGVITVLGVYDQTSEGTPDYDAFARAFHTDRSFVRSVEQRLPQGASVFQLPYSVFPEAGMIVHMHDYAHLLPYMHSEKLRYSYGSLRGRLGDQRYHDLADTPIADLPEAIAVAGYEALWVDPSGYEDGAKALSSHLRDVIGEPMAVSPNGVLVWSLVDFTKSLRERLGPEFENRRRTWNERPFLALNDGFYPKHWNATTTWYFGKAKGKAFLVNPTDHVQRVVLDFTYRSASGASSTLQLDGPSLHESVPLEPTNRRVEKTLELPPGTHVVRLRTDAPPAPIDVDWRDRVIVVENPKLTLL